MLKGLARRALVSRMLARVWRKRIDGSAAIFMFHRFRDEEGGSAGHAPDLVRSFLAEVRRRRYPVISLRDLVARAEQGAVPLGGSLVFTIDDGYVDAARVAAPLFAEFDIPVTTFAVTGFLDDEVWMWWDQVEYLLARAGGSALELEIGGDRWTFPGADGGDRASAGSALIHRLKKLSDPELRAGIRALASAVGVALPPAAPPGYRPMSWDDLRRVEQSGMEFGPHTSTHPILANSPDAEAEISGSWARLGQESAAPVPVFCYPNGLADDFGEREVRAVAGAGMNGAVVATAGYMAGSDAGGDPFRIPRFAFPDSLPQALPQALQVATGLEEIL